MMIKRSFITLFLLLYFTNIAYSLDSTFVDSLEKKIESAETVEKAKLHLELADFFLKIDLPKSLQQAENALTAALTTKDTLLIADCIYKKGLTQYLLGSHSQALASYQKALDYSLKISNLQMAALILNDVGTLVKKQGNIQQSQEYFERALNISRQAKDSLQIANSMNNLGIIYDLQNDSDKAMQFFKDSAELKEKFGDLSGLAYNLDNMGMLYTKSGKYNKALEMFLRAVEIRTQLGDIRGQAVLYNNIGEMYVERGSLNQAKEYFLKALPLAEETNFKDLTQHIYKMMSDVYKQEKDYAKAFMYYEKHDILRDSLFNETRSRQIIELEKKYETEKNRQQIELQTSKIAEQDAQLSRNYAMLVILVLSLLLLSGVFYYYKNKQIRERELAVEKAALNASILSQEDERKRFARDLHDGMGQLISACKIQTSRLFDGNGGAENKVYFERSQNTLDEMHKEIRNIAFNLMPATLISKGFSIAVEEYAARISEAANLKITVHNNSGNRRFPEQDEIFMYRIMQEWLNNIIKYAAASHVEIQLMNHDDEFLIMIEDDGNGFNTGKLFHGKGNGWTNMRSRAEYIGGKIEIDSREGHKGTTFILNIPRIKSKETINPGSVRIETA